MLNVFGGLLLLCTLFWHALVAGFRRLGRKRYNVPSGTITIGFFHPYCAAGGGGERLLFVAIQALDRLQQQGHRLHAFVFTGDSHLSPKQIIAKAEAQFGLKIPSAMQLTFIPIKHRALLEAKRYQHFTMICQSLGSMVVACACLYTFLPDVWFDTSGYAFTYPVARILCACQVAAYVHYPTISTDMLTMVRQRRPSYNNNRQVASSSLMSHAKLVYYFAFAVMYGLCGLCVNLVMVNSSWTKQHIAAIWRRRPEVVFPPCDIKSLQGLSLSGREPLVLSVGQFRPEKDHALQIRAFAKLLKKGLFDHVKLILVGSCRGAADESRVASLRTLAEAEGLKDGQIIFAIDVNHADLREYLSRASVGLHTMWNEHFGICVVEYMAAGLIPLAHNSGGPKQDIVRLYQGHKTGFLAASSEEYAAVLAELLARPPAISDAEQMIIRQAAREWSARFSEDTFQQHFGSLVSRAFFAQQQISNHHRHSA